MKSYLSTLGFNENFLLRLLTSTQANKEDKLVIILPTPVVKATKTALDNLKAQCSRLNFPEPEVYELDMSKDFFSILTDVVKIVSSLKEPIYTSLSLGMRIMNVLILLSLILSEKKFKAFVSEESGEGREYVFESSDLTALLRRYSEEEREMLNEIAKGSVTAEELAERLKKSEKTVLNKVSEFKKLGIVAQKGRGKAIELTGLGKCVVEIINLREKKQ